MSTYISDECINCGACEPACPTLAITQGEDIYMIDPVRCTECVGSHAHEACQAVCPVSGCLPDPEHPESEAILLARARKLQPDQTFPALAHLPADLSRFRS